MPTPTLTEKRNAAIARDVGMATQIYANRAENVEVRDEESHYYLELKYLCMGGI